MTSPTKKDSPRHKKSKKLKKFKAKDDELLEPMEDSQSMETIGSSRDVKEQHSIPNSYSVKTKLGVTEMHKVVLKKALGKKF